MDRKGRSVLALLQDKTFRNFLRLVRRFRWMYVGAVAAQVALTGLSLLFAETSRRLFNWVPHIPDSVLMFTLGAFAALTILRLCLTFVNSWMGSLLNESVAFEMRRQVLNHLLALPLGFHEKTHSAQALNIINNELEITKDIIVSDVQRLISLPMSFAFVSVYLLSVHPLLGGIALCIGPLQLLSNLVLKDRFQETLRQKLDVIREVFFHIEETLHGIREVKANQLEQSVDARMTDIQRRGVSCNVLSTKVETLRNICRDIPRECGYALGVGAGAVLMARGVIGPGGLVAFITLLDRVSGTFTSLVSVVSNIQRSIGGARHLYELMELPIEETTKGVALDPGPPSVTFDHVTFAYETAHPTLSDVTFTLPCGGSLALVGPSGSGKTTLVKLLYRFYEPDGGSIAINGKSISEYSLQSLRENMALVSQDIFLFDATVAENIGVGRQDATREEIAEAAALAQADEFIRALPRGFDTVVGQRGIRLSQGQKQRLSIARAILRRASLLILDEPTSALDVETEASFQRNLGRWAEHCTKVIIAHRLSTIQNADYVLFLEAGGVIECGTPSQLLATQGRFWSYWQKQSLEVRSQTGMDAVETGNTHDLRLPRTLP